MREKSGDDCEKKWELGEFWKTLSKKGNLN
jgi:hypothetical protein